MEILSLKSRHSVSSALFAVCFPTTLPVRVYRCVIFILSHLLGAALFVFCVHLYFKFPFLTVLTPSVLSVKVILFARATV